MESRSISRPAIHSDSKVPSCGNQPAHIRLTRVDTTRSTPIAHLANEAAAATTVAAAASPCHLTNHSPYQRIRRGGIRRSCGSWAVRMVAEVRDQHETEWAAMRVMAELLGVGTTETVRKWVRQAEVDAGSRAGVSTEESAELKRLKRENAELKRANAILKTASAFFAAELDRPHH